MLTNADITLYKREIVEKKETYTRVHIHGVSWSQRYKTAISEKGLAGAQEFSIRIPEDAMPDGVTISPGDWIVKGATDAGVEDAIKDNPSACQVKGVADNRDTRYPEGMRHWRVVG